MAKLADVIVVAVRRNGVYRKLGLSTIEFRPQLDFQRGVDSGGDS